MPEETAGPTPTDTGQPTPTLAADTATATTARPTATVEVLAPVDQRIQFASGATSTTLDGSLLAGQSHSFIFGALGGQTARVEVESSGGSANFSLIGLDDGQPYKRIVNEDRTWEGILPRTQEYMLTVVSADEAAGYKLLVGLVPAPPLTVIYDAHTGALIGGFKDALWVDASTAAEALLGGEQYGIYHLGQQLVQATGSASLEIGGICSGQTVQLTPRPVQTNALAVAGADWDVALRLVAPVELSQVERQAMADLLVGKGLAISTSELQVDEALGTDLDGDGTGEIIVQASRLKDDGSFPAVDAGDYFVVAVLMEIDGMLYAEPLELQVYLQADDLAYPWRYEVSGVLDLNGDGNLEVILAGSRWEGKSTVAYSVGTAGGAIPVLERSCVE